MTVECCKWAEKTKGKKLQVKLNTDISSLSLFSQHSLLSKTPVLGNDYIRLKFHRTTFNRKSN